LILFLLMLLEFFVHPSSSTEDFDVVPDNNNWKYKRADVNNDITSRIYLEMTYCDVCGFLENDTINTKDVNYPSSCRYTVWFTKHVQIKSDF